MSTASEQVILGFRESWNALLRLGPGALALNIALSALVILAAVGAGVLVRRLLKRGVRAMPGPADAEKTIRTRRVTQVTWAAFETGLVLAAFFALAAIWGFDILGWLTAGLGQRVVESVIRIAILAVATFAAAELATLLVNRLLARMAARKEAGVRRTAQLNTIGPLLHGVARGVIIIMGLMMILAEVGLEIGPLLAGAGVIGLAIGFGAQTLVKDFLTGIFLISEDIVAVGDVVEISGSSGVVEQMTIRTIRLRALDGTLHVLPYGEAQIIHNMTKVFSYHVIELGVSYESDIDKAFEVMAQVVEEMRADPDLSPRILEPLEVMDVSELADSGVVLRARIKTPPGAQWGVGRAFNRRIKAAWDAAGVEIPYPHMHLVMPQLAPSTPQPDDNSTEANA
ncbi:mechanosensitive ion channel family protein [Phenylobacterium sp.]|uniref:mechanosensitive ion channel family protein n=1 Tax=Phenylobacterium sp. TaxID=1871053 RepID=UPI00272F6789|nr:mechanosensitive ion channel domain-containing protein [Phenylobacterium sp.]MDP1618230.1 mechanosensitive ion channel [Phenylobacterium sp.]MDP1988878.1 mechanosensitive ion channel [Phenylobacterium sp.]